MCTVSCTSDFAKGLTCKSHNEKLEYAISKQHPSKFKSEFQVAYVIPTLAYVFYKYLTTDALLIKILGAGGGEEQ